MHAEGGGLCSGYSHGTDAKTQASGSTAGCNAAEPGSYFIAGWAPGGTNGAAAGDVALQLPTGPKAGLILEIHYYNNTGSAQADASGIKFCTGKAAGRRHLAAVHTLGSEGICVQPGSKTDVSGDCAPRTDMGDSHITGVWPIGVPALAYLTWAFERLGTAGGARPGAAAGSPSPRCAPPTWTSFTLTAQTWRPRGRTAQSLREAPADVAQHRLHCACGSNRR